MLTSTLLDVDSTILTATKCPSTTFKLTIAVTVVDKGLLAIL